MRCCFLRVGSFSPYLHSGSIRCPSLHSSRKKKAEEPAKPAEKEQPKPKSSSEKKQSQKNAALAAKLQAIRQPSDPIEKARRDAAQAVSLSTLKPAEGSRHAEKRVGRGPGSGRGKTSGRGHKGQKARNTVHRWFEGGQTPLFRRVRKFGFRNRNQVRYQPLNLYRLQQWLDRGLLDLSQKITMRTMLQAGMFKRIRHGVKLLADGYKNFNPPAPVHLEVSATSTRAREIIEATGGSVTTVYFSRDALRKYLKAPTLESIRHRFPSVPRKRAARFDLPRLELPHLPSPPAAAAPIPEVKLEAPPPQASA